MCCLAACLDDGRIFEVVVASKHCYHDGPAHKNSEDIDDSCTLRLHA